MFGKTVTDCLTDPQQFGHRDVFLKFESREKAADARRYYRAHELFYGVRVEFEFGTEEEFIAMKDLNNQVSSDGTPLHAAPHLSEVQLSESTPTPTQAPEPPIPRGQRSKSFNTASGNFPKFRQRLPDGTYEGQTACIYLGNVPFKLLVDKRDMWKHFEGFGEILDIRIRKYCSSLSEAFFN